MIEVQTGFRRRPAQGANPLEQLDPTLDTGELDRALISLVGSVRSGVDVPALPSEPAPLAAPATRRTGRRQRTVLGLSRTALAGVAVVAALTGTAAMASGAYFTSSKSVADNTATTGSVSAKLQNNGSTTTPYTVANIVPLSTADAADITKGSFLTATVKNEGKVPLVWSVQVQSPTTSVAAVDTALRVQTCTANCGQFSSWTTAATVGAVQPVISSAELAIATTTEVKYRFYLTSDAANSTQGGTVSFALVTKAMQGGTGITPTNATFADIPNPT